MKPTQEQIVRPTLFDFLDEPWRNQESSLAIGGAATYVQPTKVAEIHNRRYLGNKFRLTSFIREIVDQNCPDVKVVADIFAGTGVVASTFLDKQVIVNDNLYSNYICHLAWFGSEKYDKQKVEDYVAWYNSIEVDEDNYMSLNFADTYFSIEDCRKIGFIREHIEEKYKSHEINARERAILITSLLYGMDKIANTCGHYDAWRQGVVFDKSLTLPLLVPSNDNNPANRLFNEDANELVKDIEADLVYLDPPYNSRQYCDAYHLLENVARWEKPAVFGVAKKMDRTGLKSKYCTVEAPVAFEELIANIRAKYILLSYNNMSEKGDGRSNAKISDDDILRILRDKGDVFVFSKAYRPFNAGKSNIENNEERLFLCKCFEKKQLIQSPLNYTGGKYRLLPQILPHFPTIKGVFVDLFCGGCNVGINIDSSRVIFNDNNRFIHGLYEIFQRVDKGRLFKAIDKIIIDYNLSQSNIYGYTYYGCESSKGLGDYNRDKFLKLRADFNQMKSRDETYYITLYVLIVYSFNNQIRFNSDGKFNLPVGKRDFNDKMRKKLSTFIDKIKNSNVSFTCEDFRDFDISKLGRDDFVYADPPYLITCATYNEQDGWNEQLEKELYQFLDRVDGQHVRFALSNVLQSEGKTNVILESWLSHGKYKVIRLEYDYSNSNYHKKDKESGSQEVLIVNY